MKNNKIKGFVFSSLLIAGFSNAQKVETVKIENADNVSVAVKSGDGAAELEAKKKAAAQEKAKLPKPYNDKENAELKIAELVKQAKAENKNVMIQAGGNWCIWCLRFNDYVQTTPELKEIVDKNYIYYLKIRGVEGITGLVDYPTLRKREKVNLTFEDTEEIERILDRFKDLPYIIECCKSVRSERRRIRVE